jgi:hypothetical protein
VVAAGVVFLAKGLGVKAILGTTELIAPHVTAKHVDVPLIRVMKKAEGRGRFEVGEW